MGDSNAERQRRFASKAKDAGKIRIHAWVDVSTAGHLKELATQSDATIGDAINMVVGMVCPPEHTAQEERGGHAVSSSFSASQPAALVSDATAREPVSSSRSPYLFRPIPGSDMPRIETPISQTERDASRSKNFLFYSFILVMVAIGVVSWYRVLPHAPSGSTEAVVASTASPGSRGEGRVSEGASQVRGADATRAVRSLVPPSAPDIRREGPASAIVVPVATEGEERVSLSLALALEGKR
ncbi:MAG: hypothetical protein HQL66_04855 [Magnetococcales bacterium]|nr:hypothetical protein [Magnetococcales bacterium]